MARPRKEIDWNDVGKLAALHCTHEEIASFCEVSLDTLERHAFEATGLSFAEFYAQKRDQGNISLRRKQHEVAMKGNPTMLIWMGKQRLDQSEKSQITAKVATTATPIPAEGLEKLVTVSREVIEKKPGDAS